MYSAGMPLTSQGFRRFLVAKAVVAGHQPGDAVAAEERVAFEQQRFGPAAGGRQRGDEAARPAPGDDHVVMTDDGRLQLLRHGPP
jgi:hypothetical protein